MSGIKIAVVKSTAYTDLWTCNITNDPFHLFQSSFMRCPQIGLAEHYGADFIIVKESYEYPCQEISYQWEQMVKGNMRYSKINKNPCLPFLDESFHKDISLDEISHDVDSILWNKYNIVITINACIPQRIIMANSNILWCYYVSENDDTRISTLLPGYDLLLNQDVTKTNLPSFSIGFPYTFVGPNSIEHINIKNLGNIDLKSGLFIEINNTQERPVTKVQDDFYKISNECNMPLILHNQNIIENTKGLYKAKYFLKLFGRQIRGNSAMEATSAGTLMLVNKKLLIFSDLIADNCHIETADDVIQKIKYFEENPQEYTKAVEYQRKILQENYFDKPMNNLFNRFQIKNMK